MCVCVCVGGGGCTQKPRGACVSKRQEVGWREGRERCSGEGGRGGGGGGGCEGAPTRACSLGVEAVTEKYGKGTESGRD